MSCLCSLNNHTHQSTPAHRVIALVLSKCSLTLLNHATIIIIIKCSLRKKLSLWEVNVQEL